MTAEPIHRTSPEASATSATSGTAEQVAHVERMRASIRTSVLGDVAAQVGVGVLGLTVVDDPSVWGLWAVRWMVFAGGLLALRVIDRPLFGRRGTVPAMRVLAVTHVAGGIGSVLFLPEFAPLVMLVIFANLEMVVLLPRRARPVHIAIALVGCAATAYIGVAVDTGLGESVPTWLLVAVFVVHLSVTGWATATFALGTYAELLQQQAHARHVAERLDAVTADERARIDAALSDGVMDDLSRLDGILAEIEQRLAAGDRPTAAALADRGAEVAQEALTDLRQVAHGIFPDALRRYGLGTALTSLTATAPSPWHIDASLEPGDRFPNDVEAAAFAWVGELLAATTTDPDAPGTVRVWLDGPALRLSLDGPVGTPSPRTVDRIDAADGRWHRRGDGADLSFEDARSEREAPGRVDDGAQVAPSRLDDTRVIHRFLSWGRLLCAAGLVTVTGLAVVTRSAPIAAVAGTLVGTAVLLEAALRTLRRGRFTATLVLVCLETCLSALVITAVVPPIASVTALITALPMLLALPYLGRRALDAVTAMQTVVLGVVAVIGMTAGDGLLAQDVPRWVLATVVPLAATGVAALVAGTLVATTDAAQAQLDRTRAGLRAVVRRSDAERSRIERDLHDGAQQHMVAASMQCRALSKLATSRPDDARALAARLREQLGEARSDVVALVAGAFPDVLADHRLAVAVRRSAAVCGLPATVEAPPDAEVPTRIAVPVYYCIHEGLQNAAKHAGPGASVVVRLAVRDGEVHFEVADDGRGIDAPADDLTGHGLRSLTERMTSIGGEIRLHSDGPGRGATLVGRAPLGLRP